MVYDSDTNFSFNSTGVFKLFDAQAGTTTYDDPFVKVALYFTINIVTFILS